MKKPSQETILPNIDNIIRNLKNRIKRLKEGYESAVEIDDEIIYREEHDKSIAVLKDLEDAKEQYQDNDLSIANVHQAFEIEYFRTKTKLESKMNNHQLITDEDLLMYNNATHKYNLFVNVVESI